MGGMAALTLAKAAKLREDWLKFVFLASQPSFWTGGSWPPASAISSLYLSLHTASPGEAGGPSTNEATYGSYARVAVPRTSAGWTIDEPTAGAWRSRNTAIISGTQKSDAGTQTITHIGICTASSGGKLLYFVPMPGGSVVLARYQRILIPALALTFREL
jgi:hypothetical protein